MSRLEPGYLPISSGVLPAVAMCCRSRRGSQRNGVCGLRGLRRLWCGRRVCPIGGGASLRRCRWVVATFASCGRCSAFVISHAILGGCVYARPRNWRNINDLMSQSRMDLRELHATLLGNEVRVGCEVFWSGRGCGAGGWRQGQVVVAARLEGGARPAGPGRASSRRAERSSWRGRRAGGQASRRTEVWRWTQVVLAAHWRTEQPRATRRRTEQPRVPIINA